MQTLEAIHTRTSIREFRDTPVPKDIIKKILEAAVRAPSGGNTQPWRFIVVTDRSKMAQFDPEFHQSWVEQAPAMIVVCVDPHDTWQSYDEDDHFYLFDAAAAIENMLLTIHDLGLGGVWVLSCSKKKIRKLLEIPKHWLIISLIPFGYPQAEKHSVTPRKPLSEVAFTNNAKNPYQELTQFESLERPEFPGP
jgi:nitroreductase